MVFGTRHGPKTVKRTLMKPDKSPLISVCIPVYNSAGYIEETIRSVILQEYPNLEIIVQDNRSTDGTWELLERLASEYPQVTIGRNASNVGMAPNWNIAIKQARGDFIMLLCADDMLEPGFITKCMEEFKDESIDVTSVNFRWLKNGSKVKKKVNLRKGVYRHFSSDVLIFNQFPVVFTLFRKKTIEKLLVNGDLFDEKFSLTCDFELMIRLSLTGMSLYYISEPLAIYRRHSSNLSKNIMLLNRLAAQSFLSHKKELMRRCGMSYRLTVVRFILRIFRETLRFGSFDKRSFLSLCKGLF